VSFAIGLTGGIGSGKTTVAELFAGLGAGVVDTDTIARMLTGPGQPAVAEIAKRFGPQFVSPDGSIDRSRMREMVFADARARKDLEAILHPKIRRESSRQLSESAAPYVIVVVPLLFETDAYRDLLRRVLVVDCEPETQIARVMKRNQLTREDVLAIIAAQVPRSERLRRADDVIRNDGNLAALQAQITPLHLRYLELAASR
jgi:dephospho-CoA kinase